MRYKKNYSIDGWPIEDTEHQVVLDKTELAALLNKYHDLLLWTLYHHQGAHSDVGQPIRAALGIDQFDTLTDAQIEQGRAAASGA